ncbi:MAG TPA: hypothetical protein VF263_19910 [Longimicrobiaceae bacterium]
MNAPDDKPEYIGEPELLVKQLVSVERLHVNVSQSVIITTEDKVRICLDKHIKRAEQKHSWIAPAGILLAIITTLVTTTFQNWVLKAETWQAVFIVVGIVSLAWLLLSLRFAFNSLSTDDVIEELRPSSNQNLTEREKGT